MAYQGKPLGRGVRISKRPTAGESAILIDGLADFLKKAAKTDDDFKTEMRKAAQDVAQQLVEGAKLEAASVTRSRQALEVMKGIRATRDLVPTIKLSEKTGFVSQSRPNRVRKRKVTRGDVFFGAEFGGGARRRTDQFLRHKGTSGYFFWPTVRRMKDMIAKEYLIGIDKVLKKLAD
jgi:hypothetical protein